MLELRTIFNGDQVTVALTGEVDLSNEAQLASGLRAALTVQGVRAMLVDLDGLRFLDSSGVRVLLQTHRLARERDVFLRVARARPTVAQVLRVTNVADLLGLEPERGPDDPGSLS